MKIGTLTCPGTHPGSPARRDDAEEHDKQVAALRPALASRSIELVEIDWHTPLNGFAGLSLVLGGTAWDYQDEEAAFLAKIDALEDAGHLVCNAPALMRWNAHKTYLRDLAERGAGTVPTIWLDRAEARDISAAMVEFGCETVIAKRQVGAGAQGQSIHRKSSPDRAWTMDQPVMLQPFLDRILDEGEYSFLFIDGEFSHALVKRPAQGDYRIQSLYGGVEMPVDPAPQDLAVAQAIVDAVPFATPLYARIDMVRSNDGQLLVMEAEMIEPYLYPEQGPGLGEMLALAIERRLCT